MPVAEKLEETLPFGAFRIAAAAVGFAQQLVGSGGTILPWPAMSPLVTVTLAGTSRLKHCPSSSS